jgi:Undecaprenyl-phosphate galactose phosphotransferase WbaP
MDKSPKIKIQTTLSESRNPVVNLLLVVNDILMISLAVVFSAGIRYLLLPLLGGVINWRVILNGMVFFIIFNIFLSWLNGLYPGFGLAAVHEMQKIIYVVSLATVFLGVFLFLQQLGLAYSRSIFIFTWVFSILFMMLGRFALRNRFSRFEWWGVPLVVVGAEGYAQPIIQKMIESRRLGFRPVFYFDPDSQSKAPIDDVPLIETKLELQELVTEAGIQHVVFTNPIDKDSAENFNWMRDVFPNILFVMDTASFGSLWVRTIDLHGTLVIETNYHLLNRREKTVKRIIDMVLTILLLLFTWPIFLVLGLLIRLDTKGPIFYTQKRLGKDGETFDSIKFRTMFDNAEEKLQELLDNDPDASLEYEKYHKLANDPRITRVGKFLRRYSLDELPQLFNVVKGDMNLIGPRSYMPSELPVMGDFAKIILKVRPGLTGWWQVMGRNSTLFKERLQLDEYYISNWSIWLDLYIIIKTVWVIAKGDGL